MTNSVTCTSYLDLDRIMEAQHPVSGAHDEMLFIVVHQTSEPWLKQCLHELTAARECIEADDLRPAFKMLARVGRAQQQLIQSWDVPSTMTPHDDSQVRPHLESSSGFQSTQYRMMEFMLGRRDETHIRLHERTVERIIGFNKGTGRRPGVPHLAGVLKQAFFPELLSVRTTI